MKRILFEVPGMGNGLLFSPDARDGASEPYLYLRERLKDLGFELVMADMLPASAAHAVWFWDVPTPERVGLRSRTRAALRRRRPPLDLRLAAIKAGIGERTCLFLGEPPVVKPTNDNPRLWSGFGTIFTWRDDLIHSRPFVKFRLPLPATFPEVPDPPFRERRLLANISGYKRSGHPSELYSAREASIRYCEEAIPTEFDLYGVGWDQAPQPFPSYRGRTAHKWLIYPKYRFALTYENMRGLPGYVTEKVFDALRAGVVPVYLGAPNIDQYVDREAFIDRDGFSSDGELIGYLQDMGEATYLRYRQAGRDYLATERFRAFLPPAFADTIIANAPL
jgi:hypothetical protein